MKENWYALLLAIFRKINAEDAIDYIKYGKTTKRFWQNVKYDRLNVVFNKTDYYNRKPEVIRKRIENEKMREERYRTILELREDKKTWKQIGLILNISPYAAYRRLKNFEEKRRAIAKEPTTVTMAMSSNKNSITL